MLLTVPWAMGVYFGSKEYNEELKEFKKKKKF